MVQKTMTSSATSGFIECVSNLFRSTSATKHLMHSTSLLALELILVEDVVLAVGKVLDVKDARAILGGALSDV